MSTRKNKTPKTDAVLGIAGIIADGLDASTDGRGMNAKHVAAIRLANAAPRLKEALELVLAQLKGRLDGMTGTEEEEAAIRAADDVLTGLDSEQARPGRRSIRPTRKERAEAAARNKTRREHACICPGCGNEHERADDDGTEEED